MKPENRDAAAERLSQARAHRDVLWGACQSWNEDARIAHLAGFCTALCGGDVTLGRALATEAIWS
jgi:hypothetical protein